MTIRQRFMKLAYPFLILLGKMKGKKGRQTPKEKKSPSQPFYGLSVTLNNGQPFNFSALKGKKVLIVNTASDCGFTPQYKELQQLQEQQKQNLVIIGFPANDFKEQEKGDDAAIAQFCEVNYGITFPLVKKSTVVAGEKQNTVFKWLSSAELNGWCNQPPVWNFSKYLVDENGVLVDFFGPAVSPTGSEISAALQAK
jgi:glutathione peroxidase